MVEDLKRLGKRYGQGFYEYPADARKRLWPGLAEHFPLAASQPDVEEVKKRLLYIQALETARCMEEGVLTNPIDGDLGSILGWGFPAWTGGTLSFIDTVGIAAFVAECERLAAAFVRPHFTWASPLQHPPPEDLAHQLMHAVLLTRCSWYCAGRWWADRIQLHPAISAGLQAFKPAFRGLPRSAALHCSWKAHAKTFGLTLAGNAWSGAPLLKARANDSARILFAVEQGRASGQPPLTFQDDTEPGKILCALLGASACSSGSAIAAWTVKGLTS
jgi:hypothetical protein